MSVVAAALLLGAVVAIAAAALVALRMWLAFKAKSFEHAPIAQIQKKVDEIEHRLLAAAMTGGRR